MHSSMYKRGKLKWNQRYSVLIQPLPGRRNGKQVGSLFYFKKASQFTKQASSGGSVCVDVARLFASPQLGKEVPKELELANCRIEPRADGWSTPANTFGFLVVDSAGVEYPFATDSNQMRNTWIQALEKLLYDDPNENEDFFGASPPPQLVSSPVAPILPGKSSMPPRPNAAPPSLRAGPDSPGGAPAMISPSSRALTKQQSMLRVQSSSSTMEGYAALAASVIVPNVGPNGEASLDLRKALELLSDRRFLQSRRALEALMRDLLVHAGDPGKVLPLLERAYNSVPPPPATGAAADGSNRAARSSTMGRRSSSVTATDLTSSGMLFTVRAFMGRLVELLSLEPIDSSATSRVVASALALLGSFSSGSAECLACVGSWPVLGELGFELSGLVQKTAHPGILLQATSLLKVLLAPALTAMMNNTGAVADSLSSSPAAAAANAKTGVVAITTTDDVEDILKPPTAAAPLPSTSTTSGPDVANLASDRNPLWPVLVKLSASPVEGARLASLQLLADLATVPEVAVALCHHHERPQPSDRKTAAVPPLPYAPPGSAHADEQARRAQVIKGRANGGKSLGRMVEGNEDDDDDEGDSELSDVFGQDGGAAGFTNPFFRASVANSGDGGLRGSTSGASSAPLSRSRSSSAPMKPGALLRSSASMAERVSIADGGNDPFGDDDALTLRSGKRMNGIGAGGSGIGAEAAPGAKGTGSKKPTSSPVVAQILSLLTHSGADALDSATRRAALSFLSHLLTHAQLHDASVGPLLRAVCTPDLMATATEDFMSLHAKARRKSDEMLAEAKAANVAHRMKPLLAAAAASSLKPMSLSPMGGGGSAMSKLMMSMPPTSPSTQVEGAPAPPPPAGLSRSRSMSAASRLFGDGPPLAFGRQQSAPLSPAYEDEPLRTSAEEAADAAAATMVGRVSLAESVSAAEESAVADLAALCLWHIGCLLARQGTHVLAKSRGVKPTDRFETFAAKL